jgi:hypothetical protein
MPLQNRVDPFGEIHAFTARGTLMGNRGIIHDPATRKLLRRRWTTKAWIICLCAFKGRHRRIMGTGSYTELFFLDEVTALAAGHRPCFECQRERAREFARCFAAGDGRAAVRASEIDAVLHGERLAAGNGARVLLEGGLAKLPDGAVVARDGRAFAIRDGRLLEWRPEGYAPAVPAGTQADDGWSLVTPYSTVRAIRAGFRPRFHASVTAVTPPPDASA